MAGKSREALGRVSASRYSALLGTAEEHRNAIAAALTLAANHHAPPISPARTWSRSEGSQHGCRVALSCWLDAIELANDDAVLQDNVLALGLALGLAPPAPLH